MFQLVETSSAVLSACEKYRYRLDRRKDRQGPTVAFFGVNPSTADEMAEDATTRKWHGFCERNGWGRYIVGNVFAYRSTDVSELGRTLFPIGQDNYTHVREIVAEADIIVPCWGNRGKVPRHLHDIFDAFESVIRIAADKKPILVFGITNSGDPKHPLMLGYDTKMQPWEDWLK